jgi:hypothetical protein
VLEVDVRFSSRSRYGVIGLRLYTRASNSDRAAEWVIIDPKVWGKGSTTSTRGIGSLAAAGEKRRNELGQVLFLDWWWYRGVSERPLGGDGFAIDRLPKTNKKRKRSDGRRIASRSSSAVKSVLQTRHQVTAARFEI